MEAESVKMLPGGSALNQGRHLHALGTRVRFFGAALVSGEAALMNFAATRHVC